MDLVPCNEEARAMLATILFEVDRASNEPNTRKTEYVARNFPSILLDVARFLTEQATRASRENNADQSEVISQQLKPYFLFNILLGKCPQLTGFMYSYFKNSSFQPLPEKIFLIENDHRLVYLYTGFNNDLIKRILSSYFKYLSFNPQWFSSIWNWSELGRFLTLHTDPDIRYLAACCLSIITQPNRSQHISIMRDTITDYQTLIDLQIRHRHLFDNTFKPWIGTKPKMAIDFAKSVGHSEQGYVYCHETIAKVANILLLKRDISLEKDAMKHSPNQYELATAAYIPVESFSTAISRVAYSVSVNRPCLLRGPCGSGKTALLDYVAAHTNRLNPPDYVKVQIGDQVDSKLLIGSYVCTEIPGQFDWQPGPLTKAMSLGSWIVFEDIDQAPSDMVQVIHSVIENGNLSCVSCSPIKLENPHPEFRIFFTERSRQLNTSETLKVGFGFVETLCDIIELPDLTDNDLKTIIEAKYKFKNLSQTIIKLYRASITALDEVGRSKASRSISLRDLFKLCDRFVDNKIQLDVEIFSANDLEMLYLNVVDCFLSSVPTDDRREPAGKLGQILNFSPNEVDRLVFQRKPEIREEITAFAVGRAHLKVPKGGAILTKSRSPLARTKQSLQLMESVSLCIKHREPVLLVGETGVGKTSIVQHLADLMKTDLIVLNLSQQSDSSDLLGGYRPVDMREISTPLHNQFEPLFRRTFNYNENQEFFVRVETDFHTAKKDSQWRKYFKVVNFVCTRALAQPISDEKLDAWMKLRDRARRLSNKLRAEKDSPTPMALAYSDGSLLRALKKGTWILLDEINLAEPDVLQCLLLILDSLRKNVVYMHNSDEINGVVTVHPNFRIFACMNPSTDIGKRDLASGTRARFSEFFVDDVTDKFDLRLIVESYVKTCLLPKQIENIVEFYTRIRQQEKSLSDVSGNSPVYSLRTLCRALSICVHNVCCHMEKSLLESLKITFFQQLNETSIARVVELMQSTVFSKRKFDGMEEVVVPRPRDDHQYKQVEGFWIQTSNEEPSSNHNYIITKSVTANLRSLSRIISLSQRRLPILIQGNTSVGKTSLIMHLAKLTGNKCFRINNHEHTDLEEYVGRYVLKENGELAFQPGLLVKAMKKGYWIILDELNLAPSELLEALNRVLDDNRELFIPDTRETIKAHSKFMLFATQNPPEEYAGRKLLSRAFRNRFIELHFGDIPTRELEDILQQRCVMAPTYAKKIVSVMKELQVYRRESGCFNGKDGFMTMRDLFRWGERYAASKNDIPDGQSHDWNKHIAKHGLILLEGRVRTINEADIVKDIIERAFKVQLNRDEVYNLKSNPSNLAKFKHIYFTREFKKLYVQLSEALKYKEPVLLCGQTGCGKTTACQFYAASKKRNLLIYNCHQNTESADFVGGVRPSREEDPDGHEVKQTFPWVNGPLVEAMRKGSIFLLDEISLADDAVLERINSALEPERSITLTEKEGEVVCAVDSFRIVATMNPGGDYGKKELSPALRNRFTEIYCHNTTDLTQIRRLFENSLDQQLLKPNIAPGLLDVIEKFLGDYYSGHDIISLRDVISWSTFLNTTTLVTLPRPLSIQEAIVNGASLVYFDQFGTCGHGSSATGVDHDLKLGLKNNLVQSVKSHFGLDPVYSGQIPKFAEIYADMVKFKKFYLPKGPLPIYQSIHGKFILEAPIVKKNLMKIVRAMQLSRPILLEGDPGAGKTSVISALAKLTGHKLVRINLSEQTDISDLFGSDLPDTSAARTGDEKPSFCWHDGPMLMAIKESNWILLDEMNLASQSILEGLNACFDHRGEIYIPELNKTITVDRSTSRIFACQNPYNQGADRKGLPQSFLNRFTSIFIESHSPKDLAIIIKQLHPNLPEDLISKMVKFNNEMSDLHKHRHPRMELNLRDLLYWCELLTHHVRGEEFGKLGLYRPDKFVQFVYVDRMRNAQDRQQVSESFKSIFGHPIYEPPFREIKLGEYSFIMARSILPRKTRPPPHLSDLCILKYQMPYLESIAKAIEHNKMPILVGEPGVGKRTMVRILAGLTGNQLNIIGANREMDTLELLGSYEQKSLQREIVDLLEETKKYVLSIINSNPHKQYASTWKYLCNQVWEMLYATPIKNLELTCVETIGACRHQLTQLKSLIAIIQPLNVEQSPKLDTILASIERLLKTIPCINDSMCSSGSFEWIDSVLVKSIREGGWLMIERANLMSAATLDRLNSLVEPDGTLSLNEKGSGKYGIETLVPHKDFRLILTMNPDDGELSRAMRNRGVEIFVSTRFFFEDFLMLLDQNGFERTSESVADQGDDKACLTYCIMKTARQAHIHITGEKPEDQEDESSILTHFALNYIPVLTHQIRRGMELEQALVDLIIAYYSQRGFERECSEPSLPSYLKQQLDKYRAKYDMGELDEDNYKWRNLRHDLVSLTGGDAVTAMLERDNRLFFENLKIEQLLRADEVLDNIDIVNTCINVKIFLELATHGDFDYRKAFIRDTFSKLENLMGTINNHVDLLHSEYIPLINSLLPRSDLAPVSELHVDSRNSPDIHYYLECLDQAGTSKREGLQNRWLLSLHRIMLRMVVELVEERSIKTPGNVSLWHLSEGVRSGTIQKEQLIRPCAEIASDLYDLLNGILRVVSNRCFSSDLVVKMLPKLFWISYFICKLKRAYAKQELIAICNQIPMLWALTYQKVIVPIIKDCELADLSYKNKKFSYRLQHICDFLDTSTTKPSSIERTYYKKVVNIYASTTKQLETLNREVSKFFTTLVARYTARPPTVLHGNLNYDHSDNIAASGMTWSNSSYMRDLYSIQDKLLTIDIISRAPDVEQSMLSKFDEPYEKAKITLSKVHHEYSTHQSWLQNDVYKGKCINTNRRRNAFDQFAPVWQIKFVAEKFNQMDHSMLEPMATFTTLKKMLEGINGITMSPKYYSTIIKYLETLQIRRKSSTEDDSSDDDLEMRQKLLTREDFDMYSAFLVDHLFEHLVLDHQVVGWTRSRRLTCDLPPLAPLVPEYSPIISLVGGYCLDILHLKLNSHLNSSAQLDAMSVYLWRSYVPIKLNTMKDSQDLELAQKFLHLQSKLEYGQDVSDSCQCVATIDKRCSCVEEYIHKREPTYPKLIGMIESKLPREDTEIFLKAIKLIYFGYQTSLEFAPIFTLDPALRSREKLDVYKAELAHVKLDLHSRNNLFYWHTGENLQLNEIENVEEAALYPFSSRILVERRIRLEKSISKLRHENTNRPKTDDGSVYYELRKNIERSISHYMNNIQSIIGDLTAYVNSKVNKKSTRFTNLITNIRRVIKSLEHTIANFRSDYALYSDLLTNYLVGLCFIQQGLRCLYARLEQRMQIENYSSAGVSILEYMEDIQRVFSFNNYTQGNLESVRNKLYFFPRLDKICPLNDASKIQSVLLKTVLIQLNHHITITPSDIETCIPIVRQIADLFHAAWLKRKLYFEEQRKQREELYRYQTSNTILDAEVPYEHREFLDVCAKFPTYDYVYIDRISNFCTEAEKQNLQTEEKMVNLTRSVDLSMCIDICKAHYKFFNEASSNLLGQTDSKSTGNRLPTIDLRQLIQLETEALYTIIRHCIPTLDGSFDSQSIECHLLQANQLKTYIRETEAHELKIGSLKNSIEILDEDIFDIYHSANAYEALKFQELIYKIDTRVKGLRTVNDYDNNPILSSIIKLMTKISSFLITDPLMKFVTGSHTLLSSIEDWNKQPITKELKMIDEVYELIELIERWRKIEVESWKSSLHRVKRKYIDETLCDSWFRLYEAFNNPIVWVRNFIRATIKGQKDFVFIPENEDGLYHGFSGFIKQFLEESTLGDYQIRLDLVFSFAVQTRFASNYKHIQPNYVKDVFEEEKSLRIDFEKLFTCVYNMYRTYCGYFKDLKGIIENEEKQLSEELRNEMRIVSWQGSKNLIHIKNNFRISHRKLNKVMNKYLEVLKRPLPSFKPRAILSKEFEISNIATELKQSELTLARIQTLIENTEISSEVPSILAANFQLKSLQKAPKIAKQMMKINKNLNDQIGTHFGNILNEIGESIATNTHAIQNFHSHKVEQVVINANDSKEIKSEKHKLCRQMYHSKKFAMQSVFKDLRTIGVSFQRGLNNGGTLDDHILSLEPLKGMIQNQSRLVLDAATKLVDDNTIKSCDDQYRSSVASVMTLLSQPSGQDLDSEQMGRIQGYAVDLFLDIVKTNRSSAHIYKHLMTILSATTRLQQLQEIHKKKGGTTICIYNFARVHRTVKRFNELVGRAYLAISKLEKLAECFTAARDFTQPESTGVGSGDNGRVEPSTEIERTAAEREILKELIGEIEEENSLMTRIQYEHFQLHLHGARKTIAGVSSILRDMLNHTVRNYVYSEDDLEHLESLYEQFHGALEKLLPTVDDQQTNTQPGTVLGSIRSLLGEAEINLKPELICYSSKATSKVVEVETCTNSDRLNIRLQKLFRQTMLATQDIYNTATELTGKRHFMTEAAKRQAKPFNCIDSISIKNMLRLSQVAKHSGNCFMTLNLQRNCTNIKSIVDGLTPILFIYTQDVAYYLNIILTSLNLKQNLTNRILFFFTDLVLFGLGLPYKVSDDESGLEGRPSKASEDNAGFGEGQGDNDVSKKLEFESQLDELKKDDSDESNKKDKEKEIEAHDDGVEMSGDIDAKAQGPDNTQGENNEEDEKDDEELQTEAELDKEFDNVESDEGKLDEKIWDDKDEPIGEDDEQDLRETDVDPGMKPEKDKSEMGAKDDQLSESKGTELKPNIEMEESEEKVDDSEDVNEKIAEDSEDRDIINQHEPAAGGGDDPMENQDLDLNQKDLDEQQEDLDLDSEAAQVAKDLEFDESEKEKKGDHAEDILETSEMDISLDDQPCDDEEATANDKQAEADKEDDENIRSEGELSSQDDDDEIEGGATQASDLAIDNDVIDQELEDALRRESCPRLDSKLEDPIKEAIKNMPSQAQKSAGQDSTKEVEGTRLGNHTLYNIFDEDDADELDLGEESNELAPEQPAAGGDQAPATETNENRTMNSEQLDRDATKEQKDKSSKRTLSQRDETMNENEEIKRRRILDANKNNQSQDEKMEAEDEPEQEIDNKKLREDGSSVRHLEKDSREAIEVIDILSSDDDECIEDPAETRANTETQLRPRDTKVSKKEQSKEIAPLPDKIQIEGLLGDEKSKEKEGQVIEEDLLDAEDISSFEDGELTPNSDGIDDVSDSAKSSDEANYAANKSLVTTYNTNFGLLKYISRNEQQQAMSDKSANLMEQIDNELSSGKSSAIEHDSLAADRLTGLWLDCTRRTGHLVHELCQQLQIVLQPTKMSKYKGDYKSGKRLNMRKIISYIASHYRKDKIWLRRTKPSKRTYNITLAVDNSFSMSENNCRQMTYQSLALLAKSLSLIEAGSLSVVKFGEQVQCIHAFGQPYVDAIGAQWLRELRFTERKTSYKQLLAHSCQAFANQAQVTQSQLNVRQQVNQLLVIISDGRHVFDELEDLLSLLRQLKALGVLTLFVVIDDLERNKGRSIVGLQRYSGEGDKINIHNYMECFPFPFYVILRQLETLPSILGDALRQWFELVSSC